MLQEQMCRDITTTLHKSMAKSFLSEFASRLKVDINSGDGAGARATPQEGGQGDQPSNLAEAGAGISQGGPGDQSQHLVNQSLGTKQEASQLQEQPAASASKSQVGGASQSQVLEKQPSQKVDLTQMSASQRLPQVVAAPQVRARDAKPELSDFDHSDPKNFAKQVKSLATTTKSDILMRKRQRHGQLRIGDVICLTYQEEVRHSDIEQERKNKALEAAAAIDLSKAGRSTGKKIRSLAVPDFHYKGILYSDGVTDQGVKVIAQHNGLTQNATNLFKQCLFRIEIKQDCEVNNKVRELKALRAEVKEALDQATNKTQSAKGAGADNSAVNQKLLQDLKHELGVIDEDIERTIESKRGQDDNNRYEQGLQIGHKLTYGQPVQFKHLFSDRYLTMNMGVMSQEYGCCQMYLSETTEHSWFSIEPTFGKVNPGCVINFKDFFYIKSQQCSTPFYFHIFRKPSDEFTTEKSFLLNAGQEPTPLKAKLFMSHMDSQREKRHIQSGDVVRLRHEEADGYVTVSSMQIDEVLPPSPDFLKGQIRRMHRNEKVELPVGGKDLASLTAQETADRKNDNQSNVFEPAVVNDEYVKMLKGRNTEAIYIEHDHSRLHFTASCWEIQRVNTFKGGDLILDEVYRLRHVSTGKFLAIADDKQEMVLRNSSNSLTTLFVLKSEMQTKTNVRFGHDEEGGEDHVDEHRLLGSKQRVMIMSYMEQRYLQLYEDLEGQDLAQFEHWVNHVNDPFLGRNDSASSQLRIINHSFQNKAKQKMFFYIEEVPQPRTVYAYKAGCIFDELLEFYAFLNVWAVSPVSGLDEPTERFFYDNEKAIDLRDEIFDKCQKVMYILNNIESLLQAVEGDEGKLEKCKNELVEQGILDMIFRNLEMLYYKTTPPPMFTPAFKVPKRTGLDGEAIGGDDYTAASFKIEIYVAQEIAREQVKDVALKMLDLVLTLIRAHRNNSERATKYFSVLFQHFQVHERYIELSIANPSFHTEASPEFISMIGDIFRRAQKNSVFIFQDRSANALVEYNKKFTRRVLDKEISKMMQKKPRNASDRRPQQLGIDSKAAIENIERSNDTNQVAKWLDLLEPVRFVDQQDQNIDKQLTFMNVISMFCRNKDGEGVYPYQMQVTETIFEKELVPLKFGTAKVGNILRPFVYFVRPKATMSSGQFLDQNPILGELDDTFKMQQKDPHNSYEQIFDMHELTKNHDTKGKETWPYIDYIVGVINLYAHMCLGGNQTAIKQIKEIGIDESHILCCISPDNERLEIHEKLKYVYMFLTRTMYIENDPIAPGISKKNRCYVWDRLAKNEGKTFADDDEMYAENSVEDNLVENDFYAGKANKRKAQMDDPNNSMIVLRYEQEAKDLALIRMIKSAALWFLQAGPQGTDQFFYHHHQRQFLRSNLKVKIKSLKVYLDVLYALIAEDCVDALFIENVSFICQCAMLGSKRMDAKAEVKFPPIMKATWVYILMWLCKDIIIRTLDNRQMKNAVRAIEMKVLAILDKICDYRLNLQVHKFLVMFRKFQELNLDPHVSNERALQLQQQFQDLFNFHQFNNAPSQSDIFLYQRIAEDSRLLEELERLPPTKCIIESSDFDPTPGTEENLMNKKIPFDLFLLGYVFTNDSSAEVKAKALRVLIKNFSQRDLVVQELARTDLIVTSDDYAVYLSFVAKQRQLRQLINKLVQDEMFHMVYNKSPGNETRNTKNDIINILEGLAQELQRAEVIQLKKLQNMIRHINLINDVVNVLLKRLIFKEIFYKDLFQTVVDFLFAICYSNVSCQKFLLPELNFFLDLINNGIETGMLISEVIKCNRDPVYSKDFIKYLINKIFKEGYFKSTLFQQLIRMAEHNTFLGEEEPDDDNTEDLGKNDQLPENSNQQFILKQVIGYAKFRQLLMMKQEYTVKKLGVIKTYAKKKEQYNLSKKEDDASLLQDKERLDLHLAIVDLVAACARNSPFGIAQAQKLIECEELLHSLLTDAVPYLVKKHYFNLLYEVYLRKVPGLDDSNRLSCSDVKFIQIMKWVLLYDLQHSFNFYIGLIVEPTTADSPEVTRKMKQVTREIEKAGEAEYDAMNAGRTEKDKDDERRFKAGLSAFAETQPFYVFDTNDKTEFWRYMFEYNRAERSHDGILCFLERFYRDYHIKDIKDENLQEVTVAIRDRLLAIANGIFGFVEQHGEYIRPMTMDLLKHINKAVQRIPQMRAFRAGKKRVIKDGVAVQLDEDEMQAMLDQSLNVDESRDLDNRMCGEKVLRILRDYIIKENKHIKEALNFKGITTDCLVDRDELKDTIKGITGGDCSYDEIMKALDHFHAVSLEKKQERQVMNVEPGQEGYIMNRNEASADIVKEIKSNRINFKDVEVQIKDVLKKQNYKAPNQARERGGREDEPFLPNISERDLSIAINMDLKLFTQRFFEFVHMTKNVSEIHDFVHQLMSSELVKDPVAKVQLVRNLANCFDGLEGSDEELILISILQIILSRLQPQDEDEIERTDSERKKAILRKRNLHVKKQLGEWQEVMFEAEIPELLFKFIDVKGDPFLANKALTLLNGILSQAGEKQQQRILDILKKDDKFFPVFFYIKQRLGVSKSYLLMKIKMGAKAKFMSKRMKNKPVEQGLETFGSEFKKQKIYMSQKFDLEARYDELQTNWQQDELNVLLRFLNQLCEGCFLESQLYLRRQVDDASEDFKDRKQGVITSVDLIYEVVTVFIGIVDDLGTYVYSDFRTYKLIPLILDTMVEFIYGPCIENQIFLGKWKKLFSVINSLMLITEAGNYSGIHQEAKAQLRILGACSNILLAIIDIKDPVEAAKIHAIILGEIDVMNLRNKMVEIYLYKIGGSAEKRRIYEFNLMCTHYNEKVPEGASHCLENEFCQYGYMIPRDKETIQTGFSIFQILSILRSTCPEHPQLQCLNRDLRKYDYLWRDYDTYYKQIFQETRDSHLAFQSYQTFERHNETERRLLDQLVIKCFPATYIKYLEDQTNKAAGKKSALLLQVIKMSKEQKSVDDQAKMLEKVQAKIEMEIDAQHQAQDDEEELALPAEHKTGELEELVVLLKKEKQLVEQATAEAKADEARIQAMRKEVQQEKDKGRKEEKEALLAEMLKEARAKRKRGPAKKSPAEQLMDCLRLCCPKPAQKGEAKVAPFEKMSKEERIRESKMRRLEFLEKQQLFKYYLATNFYEDNVATVEIAQQTKTGSKLIPATFMMPAYTKHLTDRTRDLIPVAALGVSQQEKLEAFQGGLRRLRDEMRWQQRLGQFSPSLKRFANSWLLLSKCNLALILLVNGAFVATLQYDDLGPSRVRQYGEEGSSDLGALVQLASAVQTAIAFVVMVSYYLQYRSTLLFKMAEADGAGTTELPGYGLGKGSNAYGQRLSHQQHLPSAGVNLFQRFAKVARESQLAGALLGVVREAYHFGRAVRLDMPHALNVLYVLVALMSLRSELLNAVLLLDIVNKIPELRLIFDIFYEQRRSLAYTLVFCLVVLHIFAFWAFLAFSEDFQHAADADDDDGPDFNLYCDTMLDCLASTANLGLRAGGGLGEALAQATRGSPTFYARYLFDFAFFLIVNIILLNIFFGIIIDAFADKRDQAAQHREEVEGRCFICGLSKSYFDIENIPWKLHIYCQHNLHSYLAFILYVQDKPKAECTGVEKYVKARVRDGKVDFYPLFRCLAIRGGDEVQQSQ